jgi:hypothetical protein
VTPVDHLAADLSALALDSRATAPAIDALLPDEQVDETRLPELAAAFVGRVSRAAVGAILLARVIVMLTFSEMEIHKSTAVVRWRSLDRCGVDHRAWVPQWLAPLVMPWSGSVISAIVELGIAVLLAGVARHYAVARFARGISGRESLAAGRRLVSRADPWVVALWPSGLAAFGTVFGAAVALQLWYVPEALPWDLLSCSDGRFWQQAMWRFDTLARYRDMCCVVSIAMIASLVVARWKPPWLASRRIAWGALLVALGGLVGAMWLCHIGDPHEAVADDDTWRMLAVLGGGLALFISLASFALRSVHRGK